MKDLEKTTVNTDLVRGHVITFILSSLEDVDKYGYEICKEIETKSLGSYKLKQPTLYSCLKRLESQDYITSYWGEVSNGGRRRYYSLTERGKEFLQKEKAEWEYSRSLLDKLVSDRDFDLTSVPPFDASELRPYTKKTTEFIQAIEEPVQLSAETIITESPTLLVATVSTEAQTAVYEPVAPTFPETVVEEQNVKNEPVQEPTNTIEAPIADVNYKNLFSDLIKESGSRQEQVVRESSSQNNSFVNENTDGKALSFNELQAKFYVTGHKFRTYSKSNVNTFYSMQFLLANKISAATYWVLYFLFAAEVAFIFAFFNTSLKLDIGVYLAGIFGGLLIPVYPTVKFLLDPKRKEKAKFDVKTSLLNRIMLYLNLALVITCIGFFVFQANIQEFSTLVKPIILPLALLLNIPLSSGIYYLLYRTKRFHLS